MTRLDDPDPRAVRIGLTGYITLRPFVDFRDPRQVEPKAPRRAIRHDPSRWGLGRGVPGWLRVGAK